MQNRCGFEMDRFERAVYLQLLNVLGEVPTRHALVNVLVTREIAEFLDPGFHIMTRDTLARIDRFEIDRIDDLLVGIDGIFGNVEAEVALAFHHRDPEFALESDFSFWRPDRRHGGGCVALCEDVGNHVGNAALRRKKVKVIGEK